MGLPLADDSQRVEVGWLVFMNVPVIRGRQYAASASTPRADREPNVAPDRLPFLVLLGFAAPALLYFLGSLTAVDVVGLLPPQITTRTAGIDVRVGGLDRHLDRIVAVWLGVTLLAAGLASVGHRASRAAMNVQRLDVLKLSVAGLLSALLLTYISHPVDVGSSNFWFHWAREVHRTDQAVSYYYLPQLVNGFFTREPLVLVFLVWLANFLTASIVANHFFSDIRISIVAVVAAFSTANFTYYSGAEEDVSIAHLCMFGLLAALLKNRWVLAAAICVVACSARPQFVLFIPCVASWLAIGAARGNREFRDTLRFTATAAVGILFYQFVVLGERRWLLNDGRILNNAFSIIDPISVDGFEIYPWSGSYVGHSLWMLPIVPLLLILSISVLSSYSHRVDVLLPAFLGVSQLAVLEMNPLFFFEFRYLSYVAPFVVSLMWGLCASTRDSRWYLPALAICFLGPLGFSLDSIDRRNEVMNSSASVVMSHQEDIKRAIGADCVAVVGPASLETNRLANALPFVLRRPWVFKANLLDDSAPGHTVVALDPDYIDSNFDEVVGPLYIKRPSRPLEFPQC